MPLMEGTGQKTISRNIGELIRTYKRKGKIGNSKPESDEKARKVAIAMAYSKAGKSKK